MNIVRSGVAPWRVLPTNQKYSKPQFIILRTGDATSVYKSTISHVCPQPYQRDREIGMKLGPGLSLLCKVFFHDFDTEADKSHIGVE